MVNLMLNFILELDLGLFHLINTTLSNKYFDVIFPLITDLHKGLYFKLLVYPLIFLYLLWKYKKNGLVIFLFCVLAIASSDLIGNWGFKKNFQRPRPGDNPKIESIVRSPYGGYSFVSNHAANMFAFAFFMSFFVVRGRFYFYLLASLIAFSRVYNGVHYPTDVITGAMLGMLVAYIYILILRKWVLPQTKEVA